jgi:hypothetical protein
MAWKYHKESNKGIVSGNIKEIENWWSNNVDDTQIILTAKTVQEMFEHFKKAYDNNKPFRFNLRGDKRITLKHVSTNFKEQLQIRTYAPHIESNYNPNLINSASGNYFETYLSWNELPDKLKEFILGIGMSGLEECLYD